MTSRKENEILSIAVLVQTVNGRIHRVALSSSDYFGLVDLLESFGPDLRVDDDELRNFIFDAPILKKPFPVGL